MTKASTHMRIYVSTQEGLRLLYALTGDSQIEIVDRLVKQELERVQGKDEGDEQITKKVV